MGILVGLPRTGGSEKDLQLNFGKVADQQMEVRKPFLPAEWYPQSGVQLTWPLQRRIGHICWRKCRSVLSI